MTKWQFYSLFLSIECKFFLIYYEKNFPQENLKLKFNYKKKKGNKCALRSFVLINSQDNWWADKEEQTCFEAFMAMFWKIFNVQILNLKKLISKTIQKSF